MPRRIPVIRFEVSAVSTAIGVTLRYRPPGTTVGACAVTNRIASSPRVRIGIPVHGVLPFVRSRAPSGAL